MDSAKAKARKKSLLPAVSLLNAFQLFFQKFVTGSYPLFAAAAAALLWANLSPESYHAVWHTELALSIGPLHIAKSVAHWIDEALMTLFFFTVGLEIKRELMVGELSSLKQAVLPIAAAVGGMLVPALIYVGLNAGSASLSGWGIPMATDIAFSLGILGLLGKRAPISLKVFLSAFAIADDLGAVLVIALFYTPQIVWANLAAAGACALLLAFFNMLSIHRTLPYVLFGAVLWAAVLGSGVHATIAGVVLAIFIPARAKFDTDTFVRNVRAHLDAFRCSNGSCGRSILIDPTHQDAVQGIESACEAVETPLQRLEHALQSWIAYLVLPLFALANSGLVLGSLDPVAAGSHPVTLGILAGLGLGKPIGILLFTYLAIKLMKTGLPQNVGWSQLTGVSFLGGIGFTMSLFITGLSFDDPALTDYAKLGIIAASLLCGLAGYLILRLGGGKPA